MVLYVQNCDFFGTELENAHLNDLNEICSLAEENQGAEIHGRSNQGKNASIPIGSTVASYFYESRRGSTLVRQ